MITRRAYIVLLFSTVLVLSACGRDRRHRARHHLTPETEVTPSSPKGHGEDASSATEIWSEEVFELLAPAMPGYVPSQILERLGYITSYNHDTKCPNWVAWKLTGNHTNGPYRRENYEFHEDMDVPSPRANLHDYSYNGLGLERGHMCPAGDNKWSDRAMDECHLLSNICPQYGKLNGGAWKYLEEDCRDCSYIVCGPIFYGKARRTIGEDKVAVPDAFFKVILRLGNNPQALGFIYPNRKCPGGKAKYVMSVDKVEEIVGMDFFSSLDDNVENKVEQSSNLNLWR